MKKNCHKDVYNLVLAQTDPWMKHFAHGIVLASEVTKDNSVITPVLFVK